jgi:hypothetical protein
MRPQDLKIGKVYRLRTSPNYGYVKVLEIIRPKEKENPHTYSVAKVQHSVRKEDLVFGLWGFIRYFRPCELIEEQ